MRRQITGYNADIMMVKVFFEKDALGAAHSHPHSQVSYIVDGVFEVTVGGKTQTLSHGDTFYAPGDAVHSVLCIEQGTIIDVFSPVREDFLATLKK